MKCIVCGAEMSKHFKIRGLMICPKCTFVCADINMSEIDAEKLYDSNYFCGCEYTDYVSDHVLHSNNFRRKLHIMEKVIGNLKSKKCYEIGSAYGFFLEQAQNFFFECSGIDISVDAIEYAQNVTKVNAVSGDFLNVDVLDKFDVVCMWDTIEHLANPKEYIEKVYDILKPNGYLCITTGDIGSVNAKIRGHKWRQIHPPTHLQYFSKNTLSKFVSECGFEVIKIFYPGNELSFRNIIYSIFCLKWGKTKWYNKHSEDKWLNGKVYVNFHDYIFMIVKKRQVSRG